jgi:predicted Rossmann fold nucleotide-binding protein DprA/Smf involved in DNA uptake
LLAQRVGLSSALTARELVLLELDNKVQRLPGNVYQLMPVRKEDT